MIGKTQGVNNATKPDKKAASAKAHKDLSHQYLRRLNLFLAFQILIGKQLQNHRQIAKY